MLPTFEDYDGSTARAKRWLPWLLIEINRRTREHAVSAAQIKIATTKTEWMTADEIRKSEVIPPKRRKELAKKAGPATMQVSIPGLDGTEVRAIVSYLRSKHRYPIGSCGKGYFWIRTTKEMAETIEHLEGRLKAIQAAVDGLKNADMNATVTTHLNLGTETLFDDFEGGPNTPWSDRG